MNKQKRFSPNEGIPQYNYLLFLRSFDYRMFSLFHTHTHTHIKHAHTHTHTHKTHAHTQREREKDIYTTSVLYSDKHNADIHSRLTSSKLTEKRRKQK